MSIKNIISLLEKNYPDAKCSLIYTTPYQLLIATRLSAQCTDARVNIVTKDLFAKYKSLSDFANAEICDIEKIIHSCGFYKTKASDIVNMSKILVSDYNSVIPDSIEELTKLPGVGRKTANLILGDIYHKPAIVCDTHCIRISNRLGLVNIKDPYKVELALKEILPAEKSSEFCHRIVLFGRDICTARNPKCENCFLHSYCKENLENK